MLLESCDVFATNAVRYYAQYEFFKLLGEENVIAIRSVLFCKQELKQILDFFAIIQDQMDGASDDSNRYDMSNRTVKSKKPIFTQKKDVRG